MTRKRFIKLLMSYGYSRNRAVLIAKTTKMPYKKAVAFYKALNAISTAAVEIGKKIMAASVFC